MAFQDATVCNTDLLQSAKYIFSIPRLTSTQFFCQTVNVPGISMGFKEQPTPFSDLRIPGDKLNYEDLTIQFLLDEELYSWISIHDWIRGITFPAEFDEYNNLKHLSRFSEISTFPQYADAELITLSANNQQKVKFHFYELFPVSISGFTMDIKVGSEATMTATATFKYKRFDIVKI